MSARDRGLVLALALGGLGLLGLAWRGHVEAASLLLLQALPVCG